MGRVAGGFVEVDDAVEFGGGADPLVEGLADGFTGGGGVAGADVGGEGGAEDLDAVGVGAAGELGEAGDEIVGGDDVVGLGGVVGVADVVDAFEEDEVFDAGLGEDVAVEAGERVGAVLSWRMRLPPMPSLRTPRSAVVLLAWRRRARTSGQRALASRVRRRRR